MSTCSAQAQSRILEPNEARTDLLRFMLQRWHVDASFAKAGLARAFGNAFIGAISVSELLGQAMAVDQALFAEEKQNLYIDEASEAKTWMDVVVRLAPSALPTRSLHSLALWTCNGLQELVSQVHNTPSGPLEWDTEQRAFVIGLRVIYAADFLLHATAHGHPLPVRPSTLRCQLVCLAAAADEYDVNPIWRRELDKVLERVIVTQMKRRASLLSMLATCGFAA